MRVPSRLGHYDEEHAFGRGSHWSVAGLIQYICGAIRHGVIMMITGELGEAPPSGGPDAASFPDFRAFVRSQGIGIRYGKVGECHSLGLIDRFFRTLKDSLSLRSIRPWNLRDMKRRLTAALIHYAYLRPHTSLGGFTPIEAYYGIRGHLPHPVSPPRGNVGDPQPDIPFDYVFLDPENRAFPALVDTAA